MKYSGYTYVRIEKEDGVAVVTLNRPEVLNALNRDAHDQVERVFEDLGRDEEVRAIILTGAGRAFCAGGDLKEMEARVGRELNRPITEVREMMKRARKLIENILDLDKPVIAAVNGAATGLGASLALACDIVVAAENAKIGDTHTRVGLTPGDGGLVLWPLLVGPAKAKELLMLGDLIDAREAQSIGLISKVVPPNELMPTCKALAKRLAEGPSTAIIWTKLVINKMIKQSFNSIFDLGISLEMHTFNTDDHKKAARAFIERAKSGSKAE